jgi:dTDP-4-dehydrorhamnose reductase
MRIVVTGTKGQVVQALVETGAGGENEIIPVGLPELDLAKPSTIEPAIRAARPDLIVSAAAYTAVDKAESEPELAHAVNAAGAGAVAAVAASLNIPIIHISTDYVFSGDKTTPYLEDDATGPISVYGHSKLAGEQRVADATANHVILRTAWVYSPFGANFVKTMLRLAETRPSLRVVGDQVGRPTSALDIAAAILAIADRLKQDTDPRLRGIFHLAASGEANWADFAREIFHGLYLRTGKQIDVESIATSEYPTPAKRPANSRLSTDKLKAIYNVVAPDWRVSTDVVLDRLIGHVA